MLSMQQKSLPPLHKNNKQPVQVGFANTQIALLSDTDTGHVTALLERVRALLNTHDCSNEMKANEEPSQPTLRVGSRLDRGILRKDHPNEDCLFIAQSV